MPYTFLDLFAGAGGFTLGMEAAGFLSLGAIEVDPVAARTLEVNFGRRPLDFTGREEGDVRRISGEDVLRRMEKGNLGGLDLLIASPPCQGFSRVGRGKLDFLARKRGAFACDERNSLYEHAIRLLESLRPRIFLFENVTGILHLRRRNVAEDVCEAVSEVGYVPKCTILNSVWYGVPQTRERVIIMGVREDLGIMPEFPSIKFQTNANAGPYSDGKCTPGIWNNPDFFLDPKSLDVGLKTKTAVSVREAFDDLPEFKDHLDAYKTGRKYRSLRELFPPVDYAREPRNWYCHRMRDWSPRFKSALVSDHFCRWTPRDFDTFAMMKPGDRYREAVLLATERFREAAAKYDSEGDTSNPRPRYSEYVPPYPEGSFNDKWRKLIPSQPSWTITAHLSKDTYSHIHFDSDQARAITIREAARIQSFPDAFKLEGNMGDVLRQIGNAVPPLMAEAIGETVAAILTRDDVDSALLNAKRAF